MINVKLNNSGPLEILCLGSHCDDIEIGCGATLLKIFDQYKIGSVYWAVMCSNNERKKEALASAEAFLDGIHEKHIHIMNFRDGFLPYSGYELKETFEAVKNEFKPNLIFTHYRHDLHQDHRKINELTLNTFRDNLILEYEIIKYDGDLGNPNLYVVLDSDYVNKKIRLLMDCYGSQAIGKKWFSEDTFRSVMRLRGVESATVYAEAFYARKMVL